jgi:hypothetical protein
MAIIPPGVAGATVNGNITSMALSRKEATTIALDPDTNRLLSRAARERGVSRSEFIRQHLALVLEQYRTHPKPASSGVVGTLRERETRASCSVASSANTPALICTPGPFSTT